MQIHSVMFGGKDFVISVGKPEMKFPFTHLSTQVLEMIWHLDCNCYGGAVPRYGI